MDNTKTIIRALPSKYLVRLDTYGTPVRVSFELSNIFGHISKNGKSEKDKHLQINTQIQIHTNIRIHRTLFSKNLFRNFARK